MDKFKKLNEIIILTEKKLKLLREYQTSLRCENAKIIVEERLNDNIYTYYIIDQTTKEIIESGCKQKIYNFLGKREYTEIYWLYLTK